jgi:hypothetical protein
VAAHLLVVAVAAVSEMVDFAPYGVDPVRLVRPT